MELKDIFYKIADRLTDGRGQAIKCFADGTRGVCQYLTDDGNQCAVGALINPADAASLTGGVHNAITQLGSQGKLHNYTFLVQYVHWLVALQRVHDADDNWDDNKLSLQGRREFGLLIAAAGFKHDAKLGAFF